MFQSPVIITALREPKITWIWTKILNYVFTIVTQLRLYLSVQNSVFIALEKKIKVAFLQQLKLLDKEKYLLFK